MDSLRRNLPTLLALAALALVGYQHLALRALDKELRAMLPLVTARLEDSQPDQEPRLRQLEARLATLGAAPAPGPPPAAAPTPAAAPPTAAPPAAAPPPAPAPAPAAALPTNPAAQQEQIAVRLMARWRAQPPVLASAAGRQRWLTEVAGKVRLSSRQVADLTPILEYEAERRNDILEQQASNVQTPSAAWTELNKLNQEVGQRANRILDRDQQLAWHMEHVRAQVSAAAPAPAR